MDAVNEGHILFFVLRVLIIEFWWLHINIASGDRFSVKCLTSIVILQIGRSRIFDIELNPQFPVAWSSIWMLSLAQNDKREKRLSRVCYLYIYLCNASWLLYKTHMQHICQCFYRRLGHIVWNTTGFLHVIYKNGLAWDSCTFCGFKSVFSSLFSYIIVSL